MFKTITPERAGISSRTVKGFVEKLERYGSVCHSVMLIRGNGIIAEGYWKPFSRDKIHRMYSETKSFVGIAVGLLADEGKISLDDKIADYFKDRYERELPAFLSEQTVRDMLTMRTSGLPKLWFHTYVDPTRCYFETGAASRPSGTLWEYDSTGTQTLCALVERVSGMSMLDYLKEKLFNKMGSFSSAKLYKASNNDSFGASSMICTTEDMASFAKLLMDGGVYNGEQLISREFLKDALSAKADNDILGFDDPVHQGYGYQIWRFPEGGFGFTGMGDQLTVCYPEKDLIFVCTSDNQGYTQMRPMIIALLIEDILKNMGDPLPDDTAAYTELCEYLSSRELACVRGAQSSPLKEIIDGKEFICEPNKTGITRFRFDFSDGEGEFSYTNAQGDKRLRFGVGKNVFSKFPQWGYYGEHAAVPMGEDFFYDCATSAAFHMEDTLVMKVQAIDDYLGNMTARFAYRDGIMAVKMIKNAEDFLNEYEGEFVAKAVR